ncbi:hypothetical protein [Shimia sp.]|uniref:hypothetical protein n=1 Tax=Shimia sp. TaxID=1954381 RepID=UPI0032981343
MIEFVTHALISGPLPGFAAASAMLALMVVRSISLVQQVAQVSERVQQQNHVGQPQEFRD